MLAICLRDFLDIEAGIRRHEGDVFEVTQERLDAINGTQYGTLASGHEAATKTVTRRRRSKAKEQ